MHPESGAPIGEDDLHAFVDGMLDPARVPAVQRYLSERPAEAARARAFIAQRDALRAALAFKAEEPIPARLRVGHLRALRSRAMLARWRVAAAVAGLLLAGGSLGWTARGTLDSGTVFRGVPAVLLALPPATDEAAARDTDLAAWLPGQLGEAMPLPDLTSFGFALDSARVLSGEDGRSVLLRFVDAEGAAVLVWRQKAADPQLRAMRCADGPGSLVTYTWSNGRHMHAVTATLARDRLRPVAHAVKRAMDAPPPPRSGLMADIPRRACEAGLG
jgi:anti-sigma factor RsiW